MRNLALDEVKIVAGGNGSSTNNDSGTATNRIVETCREQNLPDSTKVSVVHTGSGGWDVMGNGTRTSTTITVTATCGDAKEAVNGGKG